MKINRNVTMIIEASFVLGYRMYEIYQFEMVQILGNYQMNREAKVWHDLKMIIKNHDITV